MRERERERERERVRESTSIVFISRKLSHYFGHHCFLHEEVKDTQMGPIVPSSVVEPFVGF